MKKEEFMFCPVCEAEYIEGITECADCHVPLVEKLPGEEMPGTDSASSNEDLFPIMTFFDREEAIIAKGFLESNGVDAVLSSDETIRARRGVSSPEGIRLLIKKEDKEDAEEIFRLAGIRPREKPYLYEKSEFPEMPMGPNWKQILTRILLIVSLLIIIIFVLRYFLG
ncbi:MAG: hypothetical protein JSV88_01245 [Candidatus Aminicenantes bacterium]|nr:MAG: hypothetical protein JSV88_01245 [Candidatus Aminicenantes bacterium]